VISRRAAVLASTTDPLSSWAAPNFPAGRGDPHNVAALRAGKIAFTLPLHTLDDYRDALTNSNTHRAQRVAAASCIKLIHRRGHQPRACHAEGMANCDGSAVWIHVFGIVCKSKLAQHGKTLRCERFVELDDIHPADVPGLRGPTPCGSRAQDPFP